MDNEPLDSKDMLESTPKFEAAYKSHSRAIYKYLFWQTRDEQLSEDLTSSTFEKAWVSRKHFHGGSVQAWLYRIARNTLIDHWRKKKEVFIEDPESLPADIQPSTGELLDKQQRIQELQQALENLPKEMHSVVTLRFIKGMSSKEVSAKLGLSESNVRVIQYRALKKLKERLK